MKILVTGGGGFLGSHIVRRLLDRGYAVKSIGRSAQPANEALGVEVIRGDISDLETICSAVAGCDAVFHVAAKAGVWGDKEDYFKANVIGTRNVLSACKQEGVRSLVYTSTPSVVFSGESFQGADESLPRTRGVELSHYVTTKAQAEGEALAAHDNEGLRVCAIRPHLIWGVGDPHIVPRIIDRARKGRLRIVGQGNNRVDITHVQNAAHAHVLALDALLAGSAGGKPYFLSDGASVMLWDWINDLLGRLGEPKVTKHISAKAAYRVGSILEWAWKTFGISGEPPMTRFVAIELSKDHWFDISASKQDLGYEPIVTNEQGLVELVRDMKSAAL
ncbi:NAD-dependent epimerase/dehydratase family protein [Rubellicoccus peritrichatus]|uniref:NAD-dependent epimerase/dehydratase family protein n=1 Tax=Rubellicoccus peritrichatus TaxID=3080537 RepID=A0AAQ3L5F0_9BACT|nr:NAD-dependent epimerase/dehydratase family protein [Puniceicoccus sp. CR14]WOO39326.1 NAD-dependent epimerase/dehydratase family protein [Puniceicoccus sp. CR14]